MPKPPTRFRPNTPVVRSHPTITFVEMDAAALVAERAAGQLRSLALVLRHGQCTAAWAEEALETIYRTAAALHGMQTETLAAIELVSLLDGGAALIGRGASPEDAAERVRDEFMRLFPMFTIWAAEAAEPGQPPEEALARRRGPHPTLVAALGGWARNERKWEATLLLLRHAGLGVGMSEESLKRLYRERRGEELPLPSLASPLVATEDELAPGGEAPPEVRPTAASASFSEAKLGFGGGGGLSPSPQSTEPSSLSCAWESKTYLVSIPRLAPRCPLASSAMAL